MASIYKDGNGWRGQVMIAGKRKSFSGKTKKEVEQKIHDVEHQINTYGTELEKSNVNIETWLYNHLFTNVHKKVTASTFDRYMCLYNKHIKDTEFGKLLVNQVRQTMIQDYFNKNSDLSKTSLSMIRYLLKQSFDVAINNNIIRVNPVVNIELPKNCKKVKRKVDTFTIEEMDKFIVALDHTTYKLFFLFAIGTGARLGEIIALKWKNVDLDNRIVHIEESYHRAKKYNDDGSSENIIDKKAPKTENGIRDISIPQSLATLLKKHKLSTTASDSDDHVFITKEGNHVTADNIRRIQIATCKHAGIPYHNFHAIRHTYATRLIEGGTDIKTVSTLLGHSDVYITLNTYVHTTKESMRTASDLLDRFIK